MLAFVIFVGVMGVVNGSLTFWICFTGIYIISCIFLSIQIYYMGRWKMDLGLPKRIWLMLVQDVRSCWSGAWRAMRPMYLDRMTLLLIFNITNWSMAAYGVRKSRRCNGGILFKVYNCRLSTLPQKEETSPVSCCLF